MALAIKRQLDLKGFAARLALEKTAEALRDMTAGELVEILATDPTSVREFDHWSRATGNDLLESSQFGNVFRFVLRRH